MAGRSPAPAEVLPLPTPKYEAGNNEDRPQLGLKLLALGALGGTEERQGVMVVEVEPGRLAAGRGIDPGDLILDVADDAICAPDDVIRLVNTAKIAVKRSVVMRFKSGDTSKVIA